MNPIGEGVWFHADAARQQQGPYTTGELVDRLHAQQIGGDTLIWRDGLAEWQPLRMLASELGLEPVDVPASPVVLPPTETETVAPPPPVWEPEREANATAAAASLDPYAAPRAPVLNAIRAITGGDVVLAGFWKRAAAYFIDYFIVSIVGGVAGAILGLIAGFLFNDVLSSTYGALLLQASSFLLGCIISACYFGWFHSSPQQASLGKMAIGIKVVRGNGEAITFLRGVARYLGLLLSSLLLCIGFILAAFTRRKQALHDVMCDTLVVDKWAFTAHPERQRQELGAVTWVILILGGLFALAVLAIFGVAAVALFGTGI